MNKNQLEGRITDLAGRVQERVGEAFGNARLQRRGAALQVQGMVQTGIGDVEQALHQARRKALRDVERRTLRRPLQLVRSMTSPR